MQATWSNEIYTKQDGLTMTDTLITCGSTFYRGIKVGRFIVSALKNGPRYCKAC